MTIFPPDPFYPPEPETEPGVGPPEQQDGPAECVRCRKPNEYQPGPYTCWECLNVWPQEER